MTAIEIFLLSTMAFVFAATFIGSARSHTRSVAWSTPAVHRSPVEPQTTAGVAGAVIDAVIDAEYRFAARRTAAVEAAVAVAA